MILLPGRSYGNQDRTASAEDTAFILLPGRSYGNQDLDNAEASSMEILLPGRSYGNQDSPDAIPYDVRRNFTTWEIVR